MDGDMASGREQGDRGFRVFPWQPRGAGGVSLTDVWAHDREVHVSGSGPLHLPQRRLIRGVVGGIQGPFSSKHKKNFRCHVNSLIRCREVFSDTN